MSDKKITSKEADPSLEELANIINKEEAEFSKSSLAHAKKMGEWLLQAKSKVKKIKSNRWGEWLKTECPAISVRTARLYMQVAKEWDYLEESFSATVADFTLKKAQKVLAEKNCKEKRSANLTVSLTKLLNTTEEKLDIYIDNDWRSNQADDLHPLVTKLVTIESQVTRLRAKLAKQALSASENHCPNCNQELAHLMESCLNCGWNTRQLSTQELSNSECSFVDLN